MNRRLVGKAAWSVTERLLRRDTMRRFQILQRSDFFLAEQLYALQNQKLRKLLRVAGAHCPYYAERFREVGLHLDDPLVGLKDLPKLPLLSRQDITDHLDAMTWFDAPNGGVIPHTTGGSSGEPLKFYIDRARQAADWAARWRARGWWGVQPGDPEIILWGAPARPNTVDHVRRWRDAMLNQHLLNAFDMSSATMDQYIEQLRAIQPVCVYGYASSLALLARHVIDRGVSLGSYRLRAVFTTGEVLLDHDREAIEVAFNAPVVIEYGCRDGGLLAYGCPAGELHVPQENAIVELLDADGHAVVPGEVGEVVVTYLELFAMPLIRYRTGDLARQPADANIRATCACGRASMTLTEVKGRKTDQIVTRDGDRIKRMHALSLIYVLREIDGLRQFRITQPCLERLEVDLVADDRVTPEVERSIKKGLRQRMGEDVTINLRRRDRIPPIASGKHACVISHVEI